LMQMRATRKKGNVLGVSNVQNTNFDFSIKIFSADHLHIQVTCHTRAHCLEGRLDWMDQSLGA
jgi:hypothetical protein